MTEVFGMMMNAKPDDVRLSADYRNNLYVYKKDVDSFTSKKKTGSEGPAPICI